MPLETFDGCKALARVAVRDGGKTVAVGKVLKILNKAT
jgi:translation elongation factor EF-1alpha